MANPAWMWCMELTRVCAGAQIVFSSSCTVYGNPEYTPLDEKHRLQVSMGRTNALECDLYAQTLCGVIFVSMLHVDLRSCRVCAE